MRRLPTVSSSCVRLLSTTVCECDLDLCHFDVDKALSSLILKRMFFCDCGKVQENSSAQQKFVRIEANLAYMACSPNDLSQKTRFRAMYDICMCFPFDRGWTCGSYSSYARL